ncbi:DUF6684 family protein [Halobaculum lipolyticum]|uniref:DUF6684 family protein n=1 Tax=Halobaculum lipolyticum TaxID=3032001 RepID=A0ABD5WGM6_9EURY|nr:DUF6684 family protein [Halobaculum sp. DT31]
MARIFDRDTLLDLTVNVIPLGIILFFVAAFVLVDPFGELDFYGRVLQMGLLAFPFVALAILTYVSGKAIAGDEKRSAVFFQGQATMDDAQTRHEVEAEIEAEDAAEAEEETDADAPADDADGETDADDADEE